MGQHTDLARLAELGNEGVLLLLRRLDLRRDPGLHALGAGRRRGADQIMATAPRAA